MKKRQLIPRKNLNIFNMQNSRCNNFKNDIKFESANICKYKYIIIYRNATPRKLFSSDYFYIISPFKEFTMKPILDSPYNHKDFNISSAENYIKFNSPINNSIFIIY